MKKKMMVFVLLLVFFTCVMLAFDRFRLDFSDCSLVYAPSSHTLQISASGKVLSYGQDWTVQQVYPYLYHLKLNTWSGFFWKVNTSTGNLYRVTGGSFGSTGGNSTNMNIQVDVTGGLGAGVPSRFSLRFTDAYLIYTQGTGGIQIAAASTALSYGQDWQKAEVTPYLIHIKQNNWSSFYWKVNTSTKKLYNHQGGTFGVDSSGNDTLLNIPVTVYGQQSAQNYNLNFSSAGGGTVSGSGQYSAGTMVNIQAIPNAGYQFEHWTRGALIISNQSNYTYQMPSENVTLIAHFSAVMQPFGYSLDLQLNPPSGGTVSGGGTYSPGAWVNIHATANPGYQFTGWTRSDASTGWPGVPYSNQASFGFNMPIQNLTLVANFEQQAIPGQPKLGVYIEDHPLGVIVTNVLNGYPSFGKIQNGDILTHILFLSHGAVTPLGGGLVRIGMSTVSINFPNGTPIQNTSHLQTITANMPLGHAAVIWILRGGIYRLFVWLNPGTAFSSGYIF